MELIIMTSSENKNIPTNLVNDAELPSTHFNNKLSLMNNYPCANSVIRFDFNPKFSLMNNYPCANSVIQMF